MSVRLRLTLAYALLACLGVSAAGVAVRADLSGSRRATVDPREVAVVRSFLEALKAGNKAKACRLFDALPSCAQKNGTVFATRYTILPAELGTDEVFFPVLIDDQYALIAVAETNGRFRIDDIVADPTADVAPPLAT